MQQKLLDSSTQLIYVADAEWDGDTVSTLHCVSIKRLNVGKVKRFTDVRSLESFVAANPPDKWVFHNGLNADLPTLNKLTNLDLKPEDIIDTFVTSRTVDYNKFRTHSLKEIGEYLGVHKGDYDGGWDVYTEEMGEYCDQDVIVTEAIVNRFLKQLEDPKWYKALRVEHDVASICNTMSVNGFKFDIKKAEELLEEIVDEKEKLEASFRAAFKPKLVEIKRIKYRERKDGSLYSNVVKALTEHPKTKREGDELICYDYKEFKAGSPQDRIDALWEAGWKPFDKTDGHKKALRKMRL